MDARDRGSQPVLQSFLEAVGDRVTPTTVSKATLAELCHALEDLIVTQDLAGTVIAGFQQARFWAVERERYEAMTADPRRRALVITADGAGGASSIEHLIVGADHPIAREWFVLTLNEAFSAVLFGRELTRSGAAVRGRRLFLTAWSFDPTVVDQLLSVLSETVGDVPGATSALAAARSAHPPRHAAPGMMHGFANGVVERLEMASQRWLAAEAQLEALRRPATDVAEHAADRLDREGQDVRATEVVTRGTGGQLANGAASAGAAPPTTAPTDVAEAAEAEAAPPPGTDRHALVLDADPAMRGLLEALLRRAGWEVVAAATFQAAAAAVRQTAFDVVLVDLLLVGGDPRTALAELEDLQPGLGQSTAFMADDPPAARALEGRPVIAKPVVWSELEHVLTTLTAAL